MIPLLSYLPGDISWLVPDLIGHGQCRDRQGLMLRMDPAAIARDLSDRVMHSHDAHRWVIIGHSLGALVAIELAHLLGLRGRLFLGDPPLWPCGDTQSQQEAKIALQQDSVGQRLLSDSFANFDGTIHYGSRLFSIAADSHLMVDVVVGLLGRHQNAAGLNDCGTFISESHRRSLISWAEQHTMGLSVVEHGAAGHFVFHDMSMLMRISRAIEQDKPLTDVVI
jgi:pimeloyl-ACP methyl ester carboxylesterase